MTAQQQLAELLRNTDNRAGAWQFEAQHWIRDHGPAFASLLTAYTARKAAIEALQASEYGSADRLAAIKAYDAADDAIFDALRKLTQD